MLLIFRMKIKLAAQLKWEYASDCFFQHLDITIETQWKEVVNKPSAGIWVLDALINNAVLVTSGGRAHVFESNDIIQYNLMRTLKGLKSLLPPERK